MTDLVALAAPPRWTRAAAIAILLLLPALLLWPSLLGREVLLPFSAATFPPFSHELSEAERTVLERGANLDVTEITLTFVPEWQHVRSELARGELPHWNPHARFGASLLAATVLGTLYPPNWLTFLVLDPEYGLAWNAYLGLALAGLLMFGFLRSTGLSVGAALFGAIAFAWSGTLAANVHHYQRLHSLVWLPGILWGLHRAQAGARWGRPAAAAALGMTWLAGFPSYAAPVSLVAAGYGVWLALAQGHRAGPRATLQATVGTFVAVGLGVALAAVQLLPLTAFIPDSHRTFEPGVDAIVAEAFDPMGLLGYLLPHPFGSPTSGGPPYPLSPLAWCLFSRAGWTTGMPFAPNYNYIEYSVFPGVGALLLAAVGTLAGRAAGRRFALLALLALLWLAAAGAMTAPLLTLPGVQSVPPMRFVGPACALVAWLAAIGLDRLRTAATWRPAAAMVVAAVSLAIAAGVALAVMQARAPEAWLAAVTPDLLEHYRARFPEATPDLVRTLLGPHMATAQRVLAGDLVHASVAFAVAALWATLWLTGPARWRSTLVVGASLLTAAELFALTWDVNRGRPPVALAAPALDLLRAARAEHADAGGFSVIRATATADPLPRALPPGLLVPDRIRDLHAYTFLDARSHRLFAALYGKDFLLRGYCPQAFPDDARLELPLWDALGVRFVLATDPLRHAGAERVTSPPRPFYVYERPTVLPRAFVVPALLPVADEEAAVTVMTSAGFAPRQVVVVTPEVQRGLPTLPADPAAAARAVTFRIDEANEVVLDVATGPPGYLVMSDALMSGWRAQVAGRDVEIRRGNLFMRVLPLPAGPVEVRMTFSTPGLWSGLLVSLAGLIVLVLWSRRVRAA